MSRHSDAEEHPSALADSRLVDFPRDLYLGIEDHKAGDRRPTEAFLNMVNHQRHGLIRNVSAKAEELLSALKSLKAFDKTGNAGTALPHVLAINLDLQKLVQNLADDVREAEARFSEALVSAPSGDESPAIEPAVAVEPSPQAPAAVDTVPKPGPRLKVVQVFDPKISARVQLEAFDRDAARRATR